MTYDLTKSGPGKFGWLVTEWAYELASAGCDAEEGSSSNGSAWFGMLEGIALKPPFSDMTPQWFRRMSPSDLRFLHDHAAGCIISENGDGHVSAQFFTNQTDRVKAWHAIVDDHYEPPEPDYNAPSSQERHEQAWEEKRRLR